MTMNTAAEMPLTPQEAPGKRAALIMAVVVHAVLLGFLIYGIRWQTQSPEADTVAVELVRAGPPAKAEPAPPQPKAEPEPPPPPPPKPVVKAEPKPEPKVEPKPVAKPDIAVKEKEKPKPEAKPEPEKKPNLLDKFLNMEKPSKPSTSSVSSALDKEIANAKASQAAASNAKAVADYMGRIRGKIRGNLILPPDVKGNPEANFDVVQLPSGEIISVKLRKSSGSASLDAAIERAILKSSPLPKPERGEIFSRDLDLKFRPLDD
jgi:colicin import membrane protein